MSTITNPEDDAQWPIFKKAVRRAGDFFTWENSFHPDHKSNGRIYWAAFVPGRRDNITIMWRNSPQHGWTLLERISLEDYHNPEFCVFKYWTDQQKQ